MFISSKELPEILTSLKEYSNIIMTIPFSIFFSSFLTVCCVERRFHFE